MKLLNLGCGTHYHNSWTNLDFVSTGKNVIAHNLLQGVPFEDNSFDVVYHSHVLEHFNKKDGKAFIKECHRVLKPGGIIRIAVPDLEQIARNYISFLEKSLEGNKNAENNYNWTVIEMYDQTVRNYSGGEMGAYLKSNMPNADFVYSRIGKPSSSKGNYPTPKPNPMRFLNPTKYLQKLKDLLMSDEEKKALKIGQFRLHGEVHLCMYDRFSLGRLLQNIGFESLEVQTAFDSNITDWKTFELDAIGEDIRKPDSLFMEAIKQ